MDGHRIRQQREQLGLTVTDLAGRVGVSISAVSQWERNRNRPTATHLGRLAGALGCGIEDLVTETAGDLSTARRLAGLSQLDLAERIGVPSGSLSNMEAGRARPVNKEQWAAALNISLSNFDRLWRTSATNHHRQLLAQE